jgi:hypothetical protein
MTKRRTYTFYYGYDDTSYVYVYKKGVCVGVFDEGAWTTVKLERRFPQEVDIPDTAVLLFAGSLP